MSKMSLAEKKLEVLKDLSRIADQPCLHREEVSERTGWEGSYDECYKIYDVGLGLGNFLKLTYRTSSYGSNETLAGIDFVGAKQKTITVYEF